MKLLLRRVHENATLPAYAHEDDAGMDLFAAEDATVAPGERTQVRTGVAFAIPEGHVGLIWDKSGVSHKRGVKTLGGVVDAGYRGEVLVGIVNLGSEPQTFKAGEKVAQMLIQKVERFELEEVEELKETVRGSGGFGSTGA